jgi:hypothetical protein
MHCQYCGNGDDGDHDMCMLATVAKKKSKCPKCECDGVLNTANADGGAASEWECWACHHVWKTPNVLDQGSET